MNASSNKVPVDFPLPPKTAIGFAAAFIAVIVVAATSYVSLYNRDIAVDRISHTQAVIDNLKSVSSRLTNAETAQRGYLLTGDERYLAPYEEARIWKGHVRSKHSGAHRIFRSQPGHGQRDRRNGVWIESKCCHLFRPPSTGLSAGFGSRNAVPQWVFRIRDGRVDTFFSSRR